MGKQPSLMLDEDFATPMHHISVSIIYDHNKKEAQTRLLSNTLTSILLLLIFVSTPPSPLLLFSFPNLSDESGRTTSWAFLSGAIQKKATGSILTLCPLPFTAELVMAV